MIANDRNLSAISTGKLFDIAVLNFLLFRNVIPLHLTTSLALKNIPST
jgi:hypothetical protein